MNIMEFSSNLEKTDVYNSETLEVLTEELKQLIVNDPFELREFVIDVISDINNNIYSDVFLINLLKCLGSASLDAWVDDMLVMALTRKDIDVRDAAAKMLSFHGRFDLIKKNQDRVPWMRNYIEAILLDDNGQDN